MWQYHLQQMVVADDPIAYLGEHIWQASLSGLARKSFRGRQAACRWGWAGLSWVSMRWRRFSSSRRVNFQLKGLATAL
jgi:hypothetical protein